jgi:hypothetical protein
MNNHTVIDMFRYFVVGHASLFVVFVFMVLLEHIRSIKRGIKTVNAVKHEIFLLASYLFAIGFMIYEVVRQIHQDFSWWVSPIVLFALILGDISLFYLVQHRKDNRE